MTRLNKDLFDKLVFLVLIPIFTYLINVLLGLVGNETSIYIVVATYGSIILIYWSFILLMHYREKLEPDEKDAYIEELKMYIESLKEEQRLMAMITEDVKGLIKQSRSGMMTVEQLASYEKNIETDEIWIVKYSMKNEADDNAFFRTIKSNILNRGIKYKYYIPKNAENLNYIHIMNKELGKDKLEVVFINPELFELSLNSAYTIYRPNGHIQEQECYVGLALGDSMDGFNVKLSSKETNHLIGNLRSYA